MGTNECNKKYKFIYEAYKNIKDKEVLYLSSLFHDIKRVKQRSFKSRKRFDI